MKIVDIANEIWQDLEQPASPTIAMLSYWCRNNIGQLNSVTNCQFYINNSLEIVRKDPTDDSVILEIGVEEKDVLKAIYQLYYFDVQIRRNILNYTVSPVIEVEQDGNRVRVASQTEIGRNLYTFRLAASNALKDAITAYKVNKARPRAIIGDDTVAGPVQSAPIYRRLYGQLD